jgi:hypothetical protein
MFLLTGKENHKDIRPFDINYTYLSSKLWNLMENWGTSNLQIFKFKVREIYDEKERKTSGKNHNYIRSQQEHNNSKLITLNTSRSDTPQLVTSSINNNTTKKRDNINFLL